MIGVVSGKGGVGKSMTTSLLAVACKSKGTAYSNIGWRCYRNRPIPQTFGLHERLLGNGEGIILPALTNFGIEIVYFKFNAGRRNTASDLAWTDSV